MIVHFLPSTHGLKDFEEVLMSKVRAQRKCIPLTMAVEGILRVLHLVDVEWVPIFFCTRSLLFGCQCLLAEQSVFFFSGKIGLPEASGITQLSVSVDSPANIVKNQAGSWKSSGLTIILAGEHVGVIRLVHTKWVLILFI
jgi:hypothetical protein